MSFVLVRYKSVGFGFIDGVVIGLGLVKKIKCILVWRWVWIVYGYSFILEVLEFDSFIVVMVILYYNI